MPIEIVYTIVDKRNRSATTAVKLATDSTAAMVNGFAVAWADIIDNLINGVIRTAVALLGIDISIISSNVAASSSDVEEIGAFQFKTAEGTKVLINIPAFNETLVNNDTGEIDQTLTAVQDFIALMEDGITVSATLVQPTDVGGFDVDSTVYARERSRSSGTRKVN